MNNSLREFNKILGELKLKNEFELPKLIFKKLTKRFILINVYKIFVNLTKLS